MTITDTFLQNFDNDDLGFFQPYCAPPIPAVIEHVASWLGQFPDHESALLELHAVLLRRAMRERGLADATPIVFGLARAVQQTRRPMPEEVVTTTLAYALFSAFLSGLTPERGEQLGLARRWVAQACLVAGVEMAGEAR